MSKTNKKPIWYSGRFWVTLFMVVVSSLLVVQALPLFMTEFYGQKFNDDFKLPLDVISWSYMALISLYVGTDRLEKIISTKEIPYGEVFMGDMKKLRRIIVISLLIFLESLVFSRMLNADFGMTGFFSAFASSVILYVSGNNGIQTMGNINGSHPVDATGDKNEIKDATDSNTAASTTK